MSMGGALGPGLDVHGAAALCVAGVALGDIHLRFTWQGTISDAPWFCVAGVALMALGGALGPGLDVHGAAALCVADVALGDIHLRFTWQASFHVAGVAPSHIHLGFAWQAWHS